jgi:hypothetical protein
MFFDVNSPALTPTSPSLPTSVAVAIFSGYVLDYLKRFRAIPKINYYSTRLNAFLRVVLSGIGTLGIAWTWSAAGTGHQLLITIPAWSAVALGVWHWCLQVGQTQLTEIVLSQQPQAKAAMVQQAVYKPPTQKPTTAAEANLPPKESDPVPVYRAGSNEHIGE